MSATVIVIDERGLVSLEIPDADGAVHHYAVAPAPPHLDDFAVHLERLDTGARYRVSRWRNTWACECPAWKYARKPFRGCCKHTEEVRRLELFLQRMNREATSAEVRA